MRRLMIGGAALLALGGCGAGDGGTAGAPQADGGQPADAAATSYATPDGRAEVRSGDAALSGLPEGIPPYPRPDGAGAIQIGGNSDGNEMRIMAFQTDDPPETVIAFYSDAGGRAGFREIHRASSGPSSVLGLERANGEVMNVTATGSPAGTRVQIMAGREGGGP